MRIFACPSCGGTLYFHNRRCVCGLAVGFDPDADSGRGGFAALDGEESEGEGAACRNRQAMGCNWLAEDGPWCRACALTDVAPDLAVPDAAESWGRAEEAKRWVLHNLGRWGWFTPADPGPRPRFHLLAEQTRHGPADVVMGHADGLITINVAEADPAERMRRREDLGELYRTMTGHFRHEIAHMLFLRLAHLDGFAEAFRALFGDERADYGAELERHYAEGPPPDWQARHVSAYASAHPHEDWAESVSHLLHLTDIADSFAAAGLSAPDLPPGFDAYRAEDSGALIAQGGALGLALNHVNRSMGLSDLYPFVLSDMARDKLAFAHDRLRGAAVQAGGGEQGDAAVQG